jgi:hypothetical protein
MEKKDIKKKNVKTHVARSEDRGGRKGGEGEPNGGGELSKGVGSDLSEKSDGGVVEEILALTRTRKCKYRLGMV